MSEEIKIEVERIKKIIRDEIEMERKRKRMKSISRLKHLEEHILFKIDNPNYVKIAEIELDG